MGISFSKNTKFDNVEYKDTIEFVPPIDYGKVVKVYDGDTITVAARLPYPASPTYRIHIRLAGIDTPEMKGNGEAEKAIATKARDALHELIYGKIVLISNRTTEKYGRVLADIWLGNIHVNQWLLDKGHAVKYNGGTKHKWQT
jgi:endonuclease YncB( thermonuclease family)